jgi:hypothetical protein
VAVPLAAVAVMVVMAVPVVAVIYLKTLDRTKLLKYFFLTVAV